MPRLDSRKIKKTAKKTAKFSLMPLLAAGAILASMHGAFIAGTQRQNVTLTDLGYRITNDAHTPDDLPLTDLHFVVTDTKRLRHVRYDDGKDSDNTKHFNSVSQARGS